MQTEQFSKIVEAIYDCAFDQALWPTALRLITEAMRAELGDLTVINPLSASFQVVAHYNWSDELIANCVTHAKINPTIPLGLVMPIGLPHCTTRDLDIRAFHNSRYWTKCFAGSDYYDYLVTVVTRCTTSFGSWGVVGTRQRGAFGDEDIELARLFSPHIQRSVELSGLLGRYRAEALTLRAALNTLSVAAFIVDATGRIVFRNARADDELRRGRALKESNGRLSGASHDTTQLISGMLAPQGRLGFGSDVQVACGGGNMLNLIWTPLERTENMEATTLVLLREPVTELRTPLTLAAKTFALSGSETQVLSQILEGHSLAEAAEILGIARSTAKTHLGGIFRKTKTGRQTELVRTVLSLASSLISPRENA